MTIKTKFSLGDDVWVIAHNSLQKGTVICIEATVLSGTDIKYYIRIEDETGPWTADAHESFVFQTKQELINSL